MSSRTDFAITGNLAFLQEQETARGFSAFEERRGECLEWRFEAPRQGLRRLFSVWFVRDGETTGLLTWQLEARLGFGKISDMVGFWTQVAPHDHESASGRGASSTAHDLDELGFRSQEELRRGIERYLKYRDENFEAIAESIWARLGRVLKGYARVWQIVRDNDRLLESSARMQNPLADLQESFRDEAETMLGAVVSNGADRETEGHMYGLAAMRVVALNKGSLDYGDACEAYAVGAAISDNRHALPEMDLQIRSLIAQGERWMRKLPERFNS